MHLVTNHAVPHVEIFVLARQGDTNAREQYLEEHKLFIQRVTCAFCHREMTWGQDDELSIALIAFNEAIDRYQGEKNIPFLVFARLVLKSRLLDYYRREKRRRIPELSLDNTEDGSQQALGASWEQYTESVMIRERADEINQFQAMLAKYGMNLDDLERASPRHRDTRQQLLAAARTVATTPILFRFLEQHHKLPIKELAEQTGLSRKTLERGRKYIVGLSLIIGYQEEFTYLNSYLKG